MKRLLRFIINCRKRKDIEKGMWCEHLVWFLKVYICMLVCASHFTKDFPHQNLLTACVGRIGYFTNYFINFYKLSVLQQVHLLNTVNLFEGLDDLFMLSELVSI